jgi:hypothetical protein
MFTHLISNVFGILTISYQWNKMLVASKCIALVKNSTMPILGVIYHAILGFLSWVVKKPTH